MTHLTVDLPPDLAAWVQGQIDAGRYPDGGAYLRDLLSRDRDAKSAACAALEALMTDAERSGLSPNSPRDVIETARQRARMAEDASSGD